MNHFESSLHLFQPPQYQVSGQAWVQSFSQAVHTAGSGLSWDPAAILSILSFGYCIGDRTLLNEIKRQPWLSQISANGRVSCEIPPAHGLVRQPYGMIAANLEHLLCDEAVQVCRERKEIYVLLSGGMDSRIVAAILAKLYRSGQLPVKPVAVTWGMADSRDVVYAQEIARQLGFEWIHVGLQPSDVIENLQIAVNATDCLFSPVHLHRMAWFKNVSRDALVLAASYGDSVGRAVYSGSHLLELNCLQPSDTFDLMPPDVRQIAVAGICNDLADLRLRTPQHAKYIICEHEMQGHYMRGMIANAMTHINEYSALYQMFTHPDVYSYMWSIHPAFRIDAVYGSLLERLDSNLARLPWARTNQALQGKTEGANRHLRRDFHDYGVWITGPLYAELSQMVDPEWFSQTGLFSGERIKELCLAVKRQPQVGRLYELFVWLAAFRQLAQQLDTRVEKSGLETTGMSWTIRPQYAAGKHALPSAHSMAATMPGLYTQWKKYKLQGLRFKALAGSGLRD